jgi:hypothetical protein
MSTPEIDLRNMLDREAYDEDLDDAYTRWVEYEVIPDLAKALASFEYEKFDALANYYRMIHADSIVGWIFGMITDDYDVYHAFMTRTRDDVDFVKITETYVNCFVCLEHFRQYYREVTCNDY